MDLYGIPITKLEYAQMGDLPFDDLKLVLKPDSSIFGDTVFSKEKLQNWISENYSDLMDKVKID